MIYVCGVGMNVLVGVCDDLCELRGDKILKDLLI